MFQPMHTICRVHIVPFSYVIYSYFQKANENSIIPNDFAVNVNKNWERVWFITESHLARIDKNKQKMWILLWLNEINAEKNGDEQKMLSMSIS